MENNYNGVHIISEAVIMGGITMYFHNKISSLESVIEELKNQIVMQNNQIRYLIGNNGNLRPHFEGNNNIHTHVATTPLRIPHSNSNKPYEKQQYSKANVNLQTKNIDCEGGVCHLVHKKTLDDKKVVISKISKQIEFDRENVEPDYTMKVGTFSNFSPNPVIQSVTPKPSTSISENNESSNQVSKDGQTELEKILNDIDAE